MNLKLKGVIPKFKYLKFLGEKQVADEVPPYDLFLEVTGRGFDGILP